MNDIAKGLCWGAAIVLLAVGNYLGLIDDKTAGTLFVVLPVTAVITMRGGCCFGRSRAPHGG
jgi:hypothetical protein